MRKLWLHIGSHKTGTSTLQRNLRRAKNQRNLGSIAYLHFRGHYQANSIIKVEGSGPTMRAALQQDLLERLISRDGRDAVLSTEMLFWLSDQNYIEALAKQLRAHFQDIKIVAYLRRQDSLALSHRKQVILGRAALNFYGCDVTALPRYQPHMQRYFDYASKLGLWENAFGVENIVVRKFEPATLFGGDTVTDFFNLIGVPLGQRVKNVNEALPRRAALAGLWLQQQGYHRTMFEGLLGEIRDTEKLLPDREGAMRFFQHFEDSNRRLAERYGEDGKGLFFDADFSRYPEVGNDTLEGLGVELRALEARVRFQMG